MRILLSGFYGHGNFGDDVLFMTTLGLVRKYRPHADIAVQSEASDPTYLEGLAGMALPIVRLGECAQFDLIVHGGGGNFFDFGKGRAIDWAVNTVARVIGSTRFMRGYRALRGATGRGEIRGRKRIALGLGVGTYTASSKRLRSALPVLTDMHFLGVRDPGSVANLRALGIAEPPHMTGDLAFAGGWGEDKRSSATGPVVAVIRDWGNKRDNCRQIDAVQMIAKRQRVAVILFDEAADRGLLPYLQGLAVAIYSPGRLQPVIDALAAAPAIITARAHGAICGSILGTPSLLLPIEPKLSAVHDMLPTSTILHRWGDDVSSALRSTSAITRETIARDVRANRLTLDASIDALMRKMAESC